ncbi:MAG: AarF/ABC1/UbiB kinase family protein [Thermodesulfovibrio sp.]|uniref:ABC1 kinase family protein n=1 Tax=unclassified Thermodesulfovibrio TaxID=2645936 RepID=UPI00083ADE49|nr:MULTISPECIES: AarF/ABC1/UbiB kinase family protein [unclassified Thermodesulfovibrio]MDI6715289.1 AarF/ABC1/UbiB kinase family protein [Thermodesulfovibrio sp.]ODA44149.1 ABC1 family protein [Thermodesulfovibrio sp. N1]
MGFCYNTFIMDIFKFKQTYLSAKRVQEILNIFIKHGFGQIIDQLNLGKFIAIKRRFHKFGRWTTQPTLSISERLRMAFEELGPTFIKLGQLLASRPDIIGSENIKEFKKLQDKVPPFSIDDVNKTVEKELGLTPDKIFKSFNPIPIGSASIAQVHEAVLLNGEKVIVKVRRPGIKEQILIDIKILNTLARLMEKHIPESRIFDPVGIVNEFSRSILRELDFRREARNAMIFKENFKENEKIYIPVIYKDYTKERILVMEKVEGVRIDNIEALTQMGLNVKKIFKTIIDIYFIQIFEHGFFHGDPHPGNLIVTEDGRIVMVDFGIVGKIDEEFQESYANIALAIIKQDFDLLLDNYLKLGIIPDNIDMHKLKRELKEDIEDILYPLYSSSFEEIKISEFIESIMKVSLKHKLRFLPELLLIDKVLIMLDGLARELSPQTSIIEMLKPYAENIIARRFSPDFYIKKFLTIFKEFKNAVENIPFQFKMLLSKAVRDDITVKMFHVNMPEFLKDIEKSSNKISFSLIVSAMILSSAIMHAAEVKPLMNGISIFGLITGVVAFFLGVWLIISIIRSGKL